MIKTAFAICTSSFALLMAAPSASAHITLENRQATIGSTYRAVFRVPHGCAGAATTRVRIQIPDGVLAKPMPHAGWSLDIVRQKYDTPVVSEGVPLTEGTKEVDWTGRLPDDEYDEFVISMTLTSALKPNAMLYFPTVQECEGATTRWIEIPAEGKTASDYKNPAPGLKLLPKP